MQYSPGVLTDLRSALVNNVIFASLAVKHGMHKYLLLHSAALHQMINRFVKLHCQTGEINFNDEMVTEEEVLEGGEEDVEVPKALGDVFESLAGAIYLDCGMDLEIVWRVFFNIMQESIEKCCQNPPQSPIRELFEMKHHKVRFSKVERALEKTAAR
uniref:RNase III domain-containing protein n=1 Tax=Panagrolaimus sp. JU765 TaxID=591449 RepID=A0AC34R952_9BILA